MSQNIARYAEFWLPQFPFRKGRKHELFISGCEKLYLPLRAYLHCAFSVRHLSDPYSGAFPKVL